MLGDPVNLIDPDGADAVTFDCKGKDCTVMVTGDLPHDQMTGGGQDMQVLASDSTGGGDGGGAGPSPGLEPQSGGAQSNFIKVSNPSKTGVQQDRIRKVLSWIKDNRDEDCAKWLGDSLSSIISGLVGDPVHPEYAYIGHGEFSISTIAAFTNNNNPSQTDLPEAYPMVVNDNGAFFNSGFTVGTDHYRGGASQAQVEILLHEPAHLVNAPGFGSDFGNNDVGEQDDRLVKNNCRRTLDAAKTLD